MVVLLCWDKKTNYLLTHWAGILDISLPPHTRPIYFFIAYLLLQLLLSLGIQLQLLLLVPLQQQLILLQTSSTAAVAFTTGHVVVAAAIDAAAADKYLAGIAVADGSSALGFSCYYYCYGCCCYCCYFCVCFCHYYGCFR